MIKMILISSIIVMAGCATTGEKDFEHLKVNMIKDEVLEEVGSPTRSELIDGKEKWTYRFYSGPEKNIERLMQITFVDGKVVAFGEDNEELKRREEIQKDNEARQKIRAIKKTAASQPPTSEVDNKKPTDTDSEEPQMPSKPAIFIEQKGKHAPVTHESE